MRLPTTLAASLILACSCGPETGPFGMHVGDQVVVGSTVVVTTPDEAATARLAEATDPPAVIGRATAIGDEWWEMNGKRWEVEDLPENASVSVICGGH